MQMTESDPGSRPSCGEILADIADNNRETPLTEREALVPNLLAADESAEVDSSALRPTHKMPIKQPLLSAVPRQE